MAVLHSRYHHRMSLQQNYKFGSNNGKMRFKNSKRHAAFIVRYAKRLNKRYLNMVNKYVNR